MKKTIKFILLCVLLFLALTVCTFAESSLPELPKSEWEELLLALPDDVRESIGDGALADGESLGGRVSEMSTPEYMAKALLSAFFGELSGVTALFFGILAILIVSAVLSALTSQNGTLATAIRFCSGGALISAVMLTLRANFLSVGEFFSKLGVMMGGIFPITASIWAMGGNVATASSGSATFGVMLGVCEWLWSGTVIPVACILTVLSFCDILCGEIRMGRLINAVKKIYSFMLTACMTLLLASLAVQTSIAAAADSTAARTARLVSGAVIPGIGGSVGETFRTLGTGVAYLKNVFGFGGIIMILLLALPPLCALLLTRFAFLLSAGFADMLGCASEAKLLDDLGEVYGTVLGVVFSASVMFVLALCIFLQSVVAVL